MTDLSHRPTVTVVIPCFNQARFLPAAVVSVRGQSYRDVECIVVNDGSTDDTADVASTLGRPRPRTVEPRSVGRRAMPASRLREASSSYFSMPTTSCCPTPSRMARRRSHLHPISAAVVGRCQVMDAAGSLLPTFHHHVDSSKLYEEWLSRNFVWTPGAAMFRRRVLDEIGGFPSDLGPAADYAVYLRLARTGRVRLIPEELVRYRQHETSMSRNPALMLRATLAVLRRESP